jgi:outer membrane protein OmpA-like peptidoglycan-associated protein
MGAATRAHQASPAPGPAREALRAPGQPLPAPTRRLMEARFAHDFGPVRVHTGARAAEAARLMGARAFALGRDVVFGEGRYAPETAGGLRLLAHELTHVVQQRDRPPGPGPPAVAVDDRRAEAEAELAAARAAGGREARVLERRAPRIARQSAEDEGPSLTTQALVATPVLWFELNSDELRQDADVDSQTLLAGALESIERHAAEVGDGQGIVVHGYASSEGDEGGNVELSGDRAIRVKNLLVESGVPPGRIVVIAHGLDATFPELEWNRRVEIELTPAVSAIEMAQMTITASGCTCPPDTEHAFNRGTFDFITGISPFIRASSARHGAPPLAVAGAIAEEFDTRSGRAPVDWLLDRNTAAVPEWLIRINPQNNIEHKLANVFSQDVGKANINVRTALEMVEREELAVWDSPPDDAQVSAIIEFLLKDYGMVEAAAVYIARAHGLYGPYAGNYDTGLYEAVLVDYFNQGPKHFKRFRRGHERKRSFVQCAYEDGCEVLFNRDKLEEALNASPP